MHKILMIIAPDRFRDEEYFEPKAVFERTGYKVITASTTTGKIAGSHGGSTIADITFDDIKIDDYATVVFVGGQGSYAYDDNQTVHSIARDFAKAGKRINAICHAPVILAKAGLLGGKRATVFAGDKEELKRLGVIYTGESVTTDDPFITADGPHSATFFAETVVSALAQ